MTDKPNDQNDEGQGDETTPAGAETTGRETMIPRQRFDDVLARAKNAEGRLAALETESKERRDAELAKREEWQQLAETRGQEVESLRAVAERVEALEASLRETAEAQVAQLQEQMRGLVPEFEDPRKTLAWLSKNAALLAQPRAPSLDAGAGSVGSADDKPVKLTALEKEIAKRAGWTEEEYAKYKLSGSHEGVPEGLIGG